ncbi:hypothetical protein Ndes2526B_g00501 [Nannochloris sp. 'desiccata']|nr:putative tRNA (guanine(10)-N2)-methyltransferase-like protein [Chlorella desiccata (nom. nud.)]
MMTLESIDAYEKGEFANVPLGLCRPHIVDNGTTLPGRSRYLLLFRHRYLDFRLAEVQALAEVGYGKVNDGNDGLPVIVWEKPAGGLVASPFWYIHLSTEAAELILLVILRRSMLVRCALELWGEGSSWEELQSVVADYNPVDKAKYAAADQSFKFVVESWGQMATQEEKLDIIESFEMCTKLSGPIDLKSPMHHFWAIKCDIPDKNLSCLPPLPQRYYFGRQILAEETCSVRLNKLPIYDLKKRRYIGPTSMDPELSYIMCAMGGVQKHSLFLDPFVGTGSVLIAAADIGAHTLGTDIDIRVIKHGKKDKKGQPVNIWTNFQDYELPAPLGLLRLDLNRSPFREHLEEILDVIVADPPYGVRAGARKSRSVPDAVIPDRATHIAATSPYTLAECLRDLVESAARWLCVGGKLVYWTPCAPGYYLEEELPKHPAMEMEANCEQVLALRYSRRLIVMRKVRKYDGKAAREYYEKIGPPKMALDDLRDYVYSTLDDEGTTAASGGEMKDGDHHVPRTRLRNKFI